MSRWRTLIWLLVLVIMAVLYGDYRILTQSTIQFPTALKVVITAVTLVLVLVFMYVFPVLSHYENTIRNTFKTARCRAASAARCTSAVWWVLNGAVPSPDAVPLPQ